VVHGAINDRHARTVPLRLDFLDAGKRYRAEIYRDGEGADWLQGDARFRSSARNARWRGDVLDAWLAGGGGVAVRLVPLRADPDASSVAVPGAGIVALATNRHRLMPMRPMPVRCSVPAC
jgi:alpha-glucosidase